jgi:hypothetical protein
MGSCTAKASFGARAAARGQPTLPDVSEFDSSLLAPVPTVIRLYESGLSIEDSNARVDAAQLRSDRVWFGGYAYLTRGKSCAYEAARTVQIVNAIGGLNGPIIADVETRLPAGFVQCFLAHVARNATRYANAEATYSSCHAWPGGKVPMPFWTAAYRVSAPCTPGDVPYVAWQYVSAEEGGRCGEPFPSDCSYDAGITSLLMRHNRLTTTEQYLAYAPRPELAGQITRAQEAGARQGTAAARATRRHRKAPG